MGDSRFVAQVGVGPARLAGHPGMTHGEALDVHFLAAAAVCPGTGQGSAAITPRRAS